MARHVVITSLELRSVWLYFRLTLLSMHIVKQLKDFKCLGWKSSGLGRLQYTMTLWENADEIRAFMKAEGAHRRAMGYSKKLAHNIRVYSYPSEEFPSWRVAKKLLLEHGRVLNY